MTRKLSELVADPAYADILKYSKRFTVTIVPEIYKNDYDAHYWEVTVEYRGKDNWAVSWLGQTYDFNGGRVDEPLPSSRSDRYLDDYRFNLQEAVLLAEKVAPTLKLNRTTVQDYIKRLEEHGIEEY